MCEVDRPSDLATSIDVNDGLQSISSYFRIGETKYGGRGGFALKNIPKGTVILTCNQPLSSTILKNFRKEVCQFCFNYFRGSTLKFKLSKGQVALYFCSDDCVRSFEDYDIDGIYFNSLIKIEEFYTRGLKKPEIDVKEPAKDNLRSTIASEWENVVQWEKDIQRMKPSKRDNFIPRISKDEYLEIKYILGILFLMYKHQSTSLERDIDNESDDKYLCDMSDSKVLELELQYFALLQSNEYDKVERYPYLLYSYINIYKFIKLTTDGMLQPFVSTGTVRDIIGRNLTNAFGIWSEVDDENEDKEFFGFGVYPSASFFNHSCAPNLIKKREKNKLVFTTTRGVLANEELHINYGYSGNEGVEVRRNHLKEWFFICACTRCVEEAGEGLTKVEK